METSAEKSFSLRPVAEEDLVRLVEIEQRVHRSPWSLENFKAELEKQHSRVLVFTDDETDSVIAGYMVYWSLLGDYEILNIVTDEPYRRRGFAKLMLRVVISEAIKHDSKRIFLNVRKSNLSAISLYQKLGFSISHVIKSFYNDGEEAYQMDYSMGNRVLEF